MRSALATNTFFSSSLGTVRVGQIMWLRLTWDPVNDEIRFERDDDPAISFVYSGELSDGALPGGATKFLDITNVAPNCATGDRPEAFMEVFFDNIRVD